MITVVGVGALGSHLVQFIRNESDNIKVIDFDRVEQRNVASQFHSKAGVGKKKTVALQQLMKFVYNCKIDCVSNKLTKDNVSQLLGGSDLVIDCLDNAASRRVVQEYVKANSVPCLHGALAGDGTFGRVVWTEDFRIDSEDAAGAPTCENGEFLPFIAITSSYLAKAAQSFIQTGRKVNYSISLGGVEKF